MPNRLTLPVDSTTEREFQAQVLELAELYGWRQPTKDIPDDPEYPLVGFAWHPWLSMHSQRGWPDLTLVRRRDRRLVFAELKSSTGKVSTEQTQVLALLRTFVGTWYRMVPPLGRLEYLRVDVELWRPADLETRVVEVLR